MIRKDPSFDNDKPHFYSQYWIDVAAGKSTSSSELPQDDDADLDFGDDLEPVAAVPQEIRPAPRPKAPEKKPEQPRSLSSLADLANIDLLMNRSAEMDEDLTPDIASDAGSLEPAVNYDAEAEGALDEDEADDFDYEDDEDEDDEWGESRRPKQGKPKRRERKPF